MPFFLDTQTPRTIPKHKMCLVILLLSVFSTFSLSLYTIKIIEEPKDLLFILVISIYIYCIRVLKQILTQLIIKIKPLQVNINDNLSKAKQKVGEANGLFYIFANLFDVFIFIAGN